MTPSNLYCDTGVKAMGMAVSLESSFIRTDRHHIILYISIQENIGLIGLRQKENLSTPNSMTAPNAEDPRRKCSTNPTREKFTAIDPG